MTIGISANAPSGATFIDSDTPLSDAQIAAFKQAGNAGIARYLSRTAAQAASDLTAAEAQRILAAGMAIVLVQHVAPSGWMPSAELGTAYGQAAVANARLAGCPPGVCLWLDLEGVSGDATAQDVVDYCQAWFEEVWNDRFIPSLYVGTPCGLTADDLYYDLSTEHYWHSGSSSAPIPVERGVQIRQMISDNFMLDGVAYDKNVIETDAKGGLPVWWIAGVTA